MTTKKPRTKKSAIEYTYVLKVISKDRTSYGGFVWPTEGVVTATDWAATAECGRGLHGWLLGVGDVTVSGDKHSDPGSIWLVLKVNKADIVDLVGKVKFPTCEVVFTGNRDNAITEIVKYGALHENIMYGTVTASGNSGKATASGEGGKASAGPNGSITLSYYDGTRSRTITVYVGENGIEPNVLYTIRDGKVTKVKS